MTPQEQLRNDVQELIEGHTGSLYTADAIIDLIRDRVSVVTPEMDTAAQECPSTYESWAVMLNASALGAKT